MPYFSADKVRRALAQDSPERLLDWPQERLAETMELSPSGARRFLGLARAFDAARELERARELGVRLLTHDDPDFPDALIGTPDCPLVLYALGDPSATAPAAAVVGTRSPTPYGARMARRIAGELAEKGVTVVSGLAHGIDAQAHEAALSRRGRTWAVVGGGLARVYPPENRPLAARIVEAGGCLLSELPLDARTDRINLVRRNRIVAGLCWATVVVEGRVKTGARHTVEAAIAAGRQVYAVPGPADSPLSEYPIELLGSCGAPACGGADVLKTLETQRRLALVPAGPAAGSPARSLSLEYRKILELLGSGGATVDLLVEATGIDVSRLSNILFEMELQGLVSPFPGQRYGKKD